MLLYSSPRGLFCKSLWNEVGFLYKDYYYYYYYYYYFTTILPYCLNSIALFEINNTAICSALIQQHRQHVSLPMSKENIHYTDIKFVFFKHPIEIG